MIKTKAKFKGIRTAQTEIKANEQRIEALETENKADKGRIKALEAKIKGNEININMLLSHRVEPEAEKAIRRSYSNGQYY